MKSSFLFLTISQVERQIVSSSSSSFAELC